MFNHVSVLLRQLLFADLIYLVATFDSEFFCFACFHQFEDEESEEKSKEENKEE